MLDENGRVRISRGPLIDGVYFEMALYNCTPPAQATDLSLKSRRFLQ